MRAKYHFMPQSGWINDPNGLCCFDGAYHAFFQHNPFAPVWDQMHWGHAVSHDLIHWEERPIALYPDRPYENTGGCFSGSAIERDGTLHLFYTAVGAELDQTQAHATTTDCVTFHKDARNPVIAHAPYFAASGRNGDFRDPKVFFAYGAYFMILASKAPDGVTKLILYRSPDLVAWEYHSVVLDGTGLCECFECPDMFELDGKWVVAFSMIGDNGTRTAFAVGTFDGKTFVQESLYCGDLGRDFYAPQTFADTDGRRIQIGWIYHHGRPLEAGATTAGAFSIPCTLSLHDGVLCRYPVREAQFLLQTSCPFVRHDGTVLTVTHGDKTLLSRDLLGLNGIAAIERVEIVPDGELIEVFVNGGAVTATFWLK